MLDLVWDPAKKKKGNVWKIVAVVAACVALFLVLFVALARIAPNFTDKLLYTQEELRIINY